MILKSVLQTKSVWILLFLTSFLVSCQQTNNKTNEINYDEVNRVTNLESLIPVRPGVPGETPFWNQAAKQFIYAPAFNVALMDGANKYKYIATAADNTQYEFISEIPYDNLGEIWDEIPVGFVSLDIVGLDNENNQLEEINSFNFYKATYFSGPYHEKVSDYRTSAERALEYEFNQKHIQHWLTNGTPDSLSYNLYCYPSKIIGAVVESMLEYSKISSSNKDAALQISETAANYLINLSEPEGAPLEYFPPTYMGEKRTAKAYRNQFMIIYPALTASIYLDLYDVTNNAEYKDAAFRIADTYKKLQEPNGTWKIKLWVDGSSVTDNDCIPIPIINFLDRIETQYKVTDYVDMRSRAYEWMVNNPLKTFDWSGQFEDIAPQEPYENLSKDEASALAVYLFNRIDEDKYFAQIADDLLRFCEDQFIIWEKPMPQKQYNVEEWVTPCVLEQYSCYEPINASVANMMEAYLIGYKATGKEVYRAKAIELANAVTYAQHADSGRYPTYWQLNERQDLSSGWIDWLNCTSFCAKVMMKIADSIER